MSLRRPGRHVRDDRQGMLFGLAVAAVWVGVVSLPFDVVTGLTWAASLCVAVGVSASFGLVLSCRPATGRRA